MFTIIICNFYSMQIEVAENPCLKTELTHCIAGNITKFCFPNGTWNEWANYSECINEVPTDDDVSHIFFWCESIIKQEMCTLSQFMKFAILISNKRTRSIR